MPENTRRIADRVKTQIQCTWGTTKECPRNGQITSLSGRGAFILTKAVVSVGQNVFVRIWLPSERWMAVRARVIYQLAEVGFGITFNDLADDEFSEIEALIDHYR
ncbi:MAG TPA: PilZ domain-containing protein [Pyrinomonadaceae bacterium]|nr:PilZ domain-containing protein [Pyrinomonadaceae bacterium]